MSENPNQESHRKVFISFLGTTDYKICNYYFDGDENNRVCNVRHVQEAIVGHECCGWTEKDRIFVFLTKDARAANWESGRYEPNDKQKIGDLIDAPANLKVGDPKWGLYEQLHKLAKEGLFPETIIKDEPLDNEGFSEDEIWNIFNTIESKIEENDEIYFDFTNGFRNLPMLGMVLLTYLKNTKNVAIGEIYYGAFEKLGPAYKVSSIPLEERNAPILRLKSFSNIMDFSTASNVFSKYGNGLLLADKIEEWILPNIASKTPFIESMRNMRDALRQTTLDLQTCRGQDVVNGVAFKKMSEWFNDNPDAAQDNSYKALAPLLNQIKNKFKEFEIDGKRSIKNGWVAAKWCFDNGMLQQSVTFLQEIIVTYIVEKIGLDYTVHNHRTLVEKYLHKNKKNYVGQNEDGENYQSWESYLDILIQKDDIPALVSKEILLNKMNEISDDWCKNYEDLTKLRNDLNHCGFLKRKKLNGSDDCVSQQARSLNVSFKGKLKKIIAEFHENDSNDLQDVEKILADNFPPMWTNEERDDVIVQFREVSRKYELLIHSINRLNVKYAKRPLARASETVEGECSDLLSKISKLFENEGEVC